MFTKKCVFVFLLVLGTKFSQSFAAPNGDLLATDRQVKPEEASPEFAPEGAQAWDSEPENDGFEGSDDFERDSEEATAEESDSVADDASAQFAPPQQHSDLVAQLTSHSLTKEEEMAILKKIPEFEIILKSLEQLSDDVYDELKTFLTSTVPRMPEGNIITVHFKNARVMLDLFERVVKAATAHGHDDPNARRELFGNVHVAVPQLKKEMDDFDGVVGYMRTRVPYGGTSANAFDERREQYEQREPVADQDSPFASVQLPMETNSNGETDDFADEFVVQQQPTSE